MMRHRGHFLLIPAACGFLSCATPPQSAPPAPAANQPIIPKQRVPAKPVPPAPPPRRGSVTRIPLGTYFGLQQADAVLTYDVRPAFYFGMGHIPGATNWPKTRFKQELPAQEPRIKAALAAGKPIVLYCTDLACPDARAVAAELAALGYDSAVLEGGWEAWKLGELPIQ